MKTKVINFYAGPGTGKSTTASALFAELKYQNLNVEYVTEYAKELTWAGAGPKYFEAQDMIHGMQHFRIMSVAKSGVDIIITDSPLLLGLVYMPADYPQPSLALQIREAYARYDNLDIFIRRNKPYNPKGRYQSEAEARAKDDEILEMLQREKISFHTLEFRRRNVDDMLDLMRDRQWVQ